jgi:peptide/nickel transport system substrate-binding protein
LIYATNRTAIVDAVFQGQSPIAYGPLSAVTPFYNPEIQSLYPYDPAFARQVLNDAGWTDSDSDGTLDRNGEDLKLTIIFGPWNQLSDVAQLIQSQWQEIGIDVELIQAPDFPSLSDYAKQGEYHLISFYEFSAEASVLNQFYLSDGASNWSGFSDPEVDQWLREGARQPADATRAPLYASAQQRLMDQAVLLPIRDYVTLNGTTARLDGVIYAAQGWWPLLRNLQLSP